MKILKCNGCGLEKELNNVSDWIRFFGGRQRSRTVDVYDLCPDCCKRYVAAKKAYENAEEALRAILGDKEEKVV